MMTRMRGDELKYAKIWPELSGVFADVSRHNNPKAKYPDAPCMPNMPTLRWFQAYMAYMESTWSVWDRNVRHPDSQQLLKCVPSASRQKAARRTHRQKAHYNP